MKVVAVVAALAVVLAMGPFVAGAQSEGPAGIWVGTITSEAGEIEVHVELAQGAAGEWSGTLTMPDRQPQGAELESLAVSEERVSFGALQVPGAPSFEGRLSEDGSRIEGTAALDAPPPPPGSDIYLFRLAVDGNIWRLQAAVNATDRDGYDNQPRFLPDGSGFLYTSIRGDQADIYRYDIESGRNVQVTATEQNEYSPTPLPSGDGFSTVRVEDDGTQRLWSFDLAGGSPKLLLPDVKPVGYHGWLDAGRLGLFVLGEPPTLVLASVGAEMAEAVAANIGRSIHVTPDGKGVSFVHKADEGDWRIDVLDLEGDGRSTLVATRPGSEDFTWTPNGTILMGEGSGLWLFDPAASAPGWRQVADLATDGVEGITRLAISPDSRYLAVVGERQSGEAVLDRVSFSFTLRRSN
jgi:hypothetical protein